ncbi:MAG TPA: IclR family transcriptional regulator [Flexivirga sp.]|uniref:IclR family transcriptional regulator n=1 Tax=Flexivirga sp. TaxID=1962927 RepID=UPI002BF5802A|nr:IclR family transcriptional regulator [Flexivirga sp.]HWC21110.1 IclR family transcriptional regulator [Flexivirga sp.]
MAKSVNAPTGTQAIERALSVLGVLADNGELSTGDLAQRTGLTAGTASRIAKALVAEGMLLRDPETDRYHLGPRAVVLGRSAERVLGLDKAMQPLQGLAESSHESVNLAARDGAESVVLARVQSTLPLRFVQHVGARFPLYSTASGKAMLAFGDATAAYLAELPTRLPPVGPGTLATRAQLERQLEQIRDRGYSIDIEENVEGVRCVGAPVLDGDGIARAAVVLQAPSVRMHKDRIDELGPAVATTAREVSRVIPDASVLRSQD